MIIPILKDVDILEEIDNLTYFNLRATAYISEEDDIGADCFHFKIISKEYLIKYLSENQIFNINRVMIINEFNLDLVKIEIKKILEDCIRPTWKEVASAINYYLKWEYEDINYLNEEAIIKIINDHND